MAFTKGAYSNNEAIEKPIRLEFVDTTDSSRPAYAVLYDDAGNIVVKGGKIVMDKTKPMAVWVKHSQSDAVRKVLKRYDRMAVKGAPINIEKKAWDMIEAAVTSWENIHDDDGFIDFNPTNCYEFFRYYKAFGGQIVDAILDAERFGTDNAFTVG